MGMIAAERRPSVLRLGSAAQDALSASRWGRVVAVTSRAAYLESEAGEWIWLTTDDAPMHRRGLSLSGPLPRLSATTTYEVRGDGLHLGGASALDWGQAGVWAPPPFADAPRLSWREFCRHVERVGTFTSALPAPRGLGVLLEPIVNGHINGETTESPMIRLALPAIREVVDACRTWDAARALAAAEGLIGLGEGLTPSGDDFVGGLLFGWAGLHAAYGLPEGYTAELSHGFLERATARTNRISFSLLADYAAGHGPEPLHRYLSALLAGEPPATIALLASDIVRIGHSTGWDTLIGLWAALGAAGGRRRVSGNTNIGRPVQVDL